MKKPIYYTLVRRWCEPGFKVMAVTSEKTTQVFGRILPGNDATHVRKDDCTGRFDTEAAALAKIAAVQAVRDKHAPLIEQAKFLVRAREYVMYEEIRRVLAEEATADESV